MIELGESFGKTLKKGAVIAFDAPLGAGKTTFTKGIGRALQINEIITSPTFTIISEYEGTLPFYHMDFYRIDDAEEIDLLGIDDFFYGNGICVVEWYGVAEPHLPDTTVRIIITINEDSSRKLVIQEV
ncbi:MAG: tRNA (adenosine(37)-N6)-threonylcarbamoyltransferase complex ATPase subunit type 1 TsaE [Spirochaetales bacterium]|nr:tRNA (adenosine(37)-N6)-threonylcarbamoyltransferase complex ATPase subunit type 1 TsaE [Spirochaetales bacterium]